MEEMSPRLYNIFIKDKTSPLFLGFIIENNGCWFDINGAVIKDYREEHKFPKFNMATVRITKNIRYIRNYPFSGERPTQVEIQKEIISRVRKILKKMGYKFARKSDWMRMMREDKEGSIEYDERLLFVSFEIVN